ncbi:hypothetical protein TeGR_g13116, partial [Tetraparma gracilis]
MVAFAPLLVLGSPPTPALPAAHHLLPAPWLTAYLNHCIHHPSSPPRSRSAARIYVSLHSLPPPCPPAGGPPPPCPPLPDLAPLRLEPPPSLSSHLLSPFGAGNSLPVPSRFFRALFPLSGDDDLADAHESCALPLSVVYSRDPDQARCPPPLVRLHPSPPPVHVAVSLPGEAGPLLSLLSPPQTPLPLFLSLLRAACRPLPFPDPFPPLSLRPPAYALLPRPPAPGPGYESLADYFGDLLGRESRALSSLLPSPPPPAATYSHASHAAPPLELVAAEPPPFLARLRAGSLVDARDAHGVWGEALVTRVSEAAGPEAPAGRSFALSYLGWGARFDEELACPSSSPGYRPELRRAGGELGPLWSRTGAWRPRLARGEPVEVRFGAASGPPKWFPATVLYVAPVPDPAKGAALPEPTSFPPGCAPLHALVAVDAAWLTGAEPPPSPRWLSVWADGLSPRGTHIHCPEPPAAGAADDGPAADEPGLLCSALAALDCDICGPAPPSPQSPHSVRFAPSP